LLFRAGNIPDEIIAPVPSLIAREFIWDIAGPEQQFYLGLDIGRIIGSEQYRQGKVISEIGCVNTSTSMRNPY
jgi:hypothetical protein